MIFKKGDAFLAAVLVIIIAAAWFSYFKVTGNNSADKVVIQVDGKFYKEVELASVSKEETIHIERDKGHIDITVQPDGVFVSDVDCPDKLCKKTGKIKNIGQSIVCLPYKVVISLESEKGNDAQVDQVAH